MFSLVSGKVSGKVIDLHTTILLPSMVGPLGCVAVARNCTHKKYIVWTTAKKAIKPGILIG